jgi:hypothetical protein
MKSPVFRGPLLAAALAALVLSTAPGAQPATGPWAKVPAFPTTCYLKDDPVYAKLEPALASVDADSSRQSKINEDIAEKQKNVDPMELMARMQQKMMEDPQNAKKYIEQMQSLGQQINAETAPAMDKEAQMKTESEAVYKRFQAALEVAHGPGNARWTALKKKYGLPADHPASRGVGELGVPDWVWAEWHGILIEWDRAYRATCPAFYGAGGQAHQFMQRYKTYLVQERIPYEEKFDEANVANYEMYGTPAASYRSMATFNAVHDYIGMAQKVFGNRNYEPRCQNADCQ